MKILVCSDTFGNHTTTFIYNEVQGLLDNHEVLYVCTERKNTERFPINNIKIISFKTNVIFKKIFWWLEIFDYSLYFYRRSFSEKINKEIEKFNPDVIHCHFGYEALRFRDNFSERHKRIPFIITFRGYDASQHLSRKSYVRKLKYLFSCPNVYAVFVCDFLRQNLLNSGVDVQRYCILYSGTKTDVFTPSRVPKPVIPSLVQISSMTEPKGLRYTLKAFKILQNRLGKGNVKLRIGGDGILLDEMKELTRKLDIDEDVSFLGWVDSGKIRDLLSAAQAMVLHSVSHHGKTEGIPNVLMEAMAMELPVVSTFHAGIPELVENGVNGILVKEKDVEAYAEAMFAILSWGRMPGNREKVQENFEYSVHMKKLNDFYRIVVAGNNSQNTMPKIVNLKS